jgi:hypothetical protein
MEIEQIMINTKLAHKFIKNKELLDLRIKDIYKLFDPERTENTATEVCTIDGNAQIVQSIHKELILDFYHQQSVCCVTFEFPKHEFDTLYSKLVVAEDLKNYSKEQLLLLYEGWNVYDGIDEAVLRYPEDYVWIDGKQEPAPKITLPYKTNSVFYGKSFKVAGDLV